MGNQQEFIPFDFAPTTCVSDAKLDKVDGTIELGPPTAGVNIPNIFIDEDKASRAEQRIHGQVL
jgi:hypothetical protein